MHKLKAITALGASEPKVSTIGDMTLTEVTDRALASVSMRLGQDAEFAKRAKDTLGIELPLPGVAEVGSPYSAFWIGPDSWMIDASYASNQAIAADLKSALQDTASVVEQTDGWCRFDVTGTSACDLFERLCNVDIRTMQAQKATRCAIHHIGCYLWCIEAGTRFAVLGPRSSAGSLYHALEEAAQSIAAR